VSDVVDVVKEYARQETLGPLSGAGRWLALGSIGAILLGVGSVFALLGTLRLLQTETSVFDGAWSFVPYLVVLVVAIGLTIVTLTRVKKATLGKEPRHGSK
jgi:cytochrome c biogenesis protein CcdA